ncbi:MAG: UDP-N-acetylmuramoyl-L-alanine--D-glutamate ligase [Patescibacteria group bacterium]
MSNDREYYSKVRQKNNALTYSAGKLCLSASQPLKVLVFGLGLNGGGVGSARFFSRQGAKVTITDLKSKKALSVSLAELSSFPGIKYVLGRHRWADFLASDLIVKNPAIPWDNPFLKKAQAQNIPITTDTILFFSQAPTLIVGITGTKGKSTTATLLAELLKKKYSRVWLVGNIGESFLDKLPKIKSKDIIVAELSSFQLEDLALAKKSPNIAIITNIFPDHLNRYSSFQEYAQAKTHIFLHQKPAEHLIIDGNDEFLVKLTKKAKAKKHFLEKKNLPPLEINTALAVKAAEILGVPQKSIAKVLKNFRGLAGRQETVRELKNRIFINDTTATNPTAVLIALQSLSLKYQRPIVLIAGGQDKNLDYKKMAQEINKKVKTPVLLPGNATEKLKKNLRSGFLEVKNMKEAVKKAYDLSQAGDLILLSPGAASFNLFENEFDRGEQFNQCVKNLRK